MWPPNHTPRDFHIDVLALRLAPVLTEARACAAISSWESELSSILEVV
jgi:hypothetical protein